VMKIVKFAVLMFFVVVVLGAIFRGLSYLEFRPNTRHISTQSCALQHRWHYMLNTIGDIVASVLHYATSCTIL